MNGNGVSVSGVGVVNGSESETGRYDLCVYLPVSVQRSAWVSRPFVVFFVPISCLETDSSFGCQKSCIMFELASVAAKVKRV